MGRRGKGLEVAEAVDGVEEELAGECRIILLDVS